MRMWGGGRGGGGRGSRREGWEERGEKGRKKKGSRARLQLEPMLIGSAAAQKGASGSAGSHEGPLQLLSR